MRKVREHIEVLCIEVRHEALPLQQRVELGEQVQRLVGAFYVLEAFVDILLPCAVTGSAKYSGEPHAAGWPGMSL